MTDRLQDEELNELHKRVERAEARWRARAESASEPGVPPGFRAGKTGLFVRSSAGPAEVDTSPITDPQEWLGPVAAHTLTLIGDEHTDEELTTASKRYLAGEDEEVELEVWAAEMRTIYILDREHAGEKEALSKLEAADLAREVATQHLAEVRRRMPLNQAAADAGSPG